MEGTAKKDLYAAFRKILRPLVRILLRNGVAFGEFSEVAKATYVEVAARDFKVPGKRTTRARVAVITGLTRKDVTRVIKDEDKFSDENPSKSNRVSRVLFGWHSDSEFTGPYGLPRELRFDTGGVADFSSLVRKFSGDMPARAVLDELLRVGAVEEIDHGWYRILTKTYIPEMMSAENVEILGSTIEQFVETVDFNLMKEAAGKGRFERKVVPDNGLLPQDVPAFDEFIRERGQNFLDEIDNWIASRRKPRPEQGDKWTITGVGVYHYVDRQIDQKPIKEILGADDEQQGDDQFDETD